MGLKYTEIEIPKDDPFKFCKLKRRPYAEALTSILNNFSESFVLSINNQWGTGKTTFVKMWKQYLSNEGFNTLYFNAWESDFESDPLVALMSELQTLTKKSDATFKSLIKNGSKITQKVLPALIKAIAEKYIETKVITDAIEKITESTSEILRDEINEYATKKQGLKDFRTDLEKFLSENNSDKPLIFFIDELDRCKPDYAVEVLEKVKHFFNVRGIIFVLSIDKIQLTNAIRGYYGSEKIDGMEYLRRFIDVEYNIPLPDSNLFIKYLYDYLDLKSFFNSTERSQFQEFRDEPQTFLKFAKTIFQNPNLTLRQQEKIFTRVSWLLLL
ncbi:P-loop NTPase fold protein [Mucilaginibacter sp. OK283]|jgi:predicted KAP-like P-loop ATPase|uniref:KAP family P-loop NTPase fold protein n=1 Tax=Mucilaginibacter sp. OK283 TaxID=1881049 RepID=UPI0008D573E5|nr:P-loop NTPase fold protein [Mucilaginibacter sp. OK283]SEO44646.1 KAP family P-loop domain-containing protein [Mucilaginibacter sp. OK283]